MAKLTKLTKTETKLLELMQNRQKRGLHPVYTAEFYGGNGPEGGRVRGGIREYNAARKLVQKGFAQLHNTHKSNIVRAGWYVHVYSITIKLLSDVQAPSAVIPTPNETTP
jgi:hypothetical protein